VRAAIDMVGFPGDRNILYCGRPHWHAQKLQRYLTSIVDPTKGQIPTSSRVIIMAIAQTEYLVSFEPKEHGNEEGRDLYSSGPTELVPWSIS